MIELPDAAEARVEGDLGDLQVRVFNQISREMHAVRSRDFNRRRAQMLYEQAAQMARGEQAGYLKVYDYHRERGGYVRGDAVRPVGAANAAASSPPERGDCACAVTGASGPMGVTSSLSGITTTICPRSIRTV